MLTIEEIRKRLADRNLSKVAEKVGCTRCYLHLIRSGKQTPKQGGAIVERLTEYLESNP